MTFTDIISFRMPSPNEMRRKLLEEAQRDLVETTKQREYYAAMEPMLKARVQRLRDEIANEPTS